MEISLWSALRLWEATIALAIGTPGSQSDFAKEVARIMGNVAASNSKRMQCTVDIKSLQPWSVGVSGIPYMVGVAEELGQKFVDEVLTIKGGWFHISCELVDLQARRS